LTRPQLLDAQHPKSREAGNEAHEEMLFITTHRACRPRRRRCYLAP
jgi:tryptophan 2,3-dioxygenase